MADGSFGPKGDSGEQMDERTNRRMDEQTNRRTDKRTNRQTDERTDNLFKALVLAIKSVILFSENTIS